MRTRDVLCKTIFQSLLLAGATGAAFSCNFIPIAAELSDGISGTDLREEMFKASEKASIPALPLVGVKFTGFDPATCPGGAPSGPELPNALTLSQLVVRHMLSEVLFTALSGIENGKTYSRSSMENCKQKLAALLPLWTLLQTETLHNAYCSGNFEQAMNSPDQLISGHVVAGQICEFEELNTVQVLQYGLF